MPCRAVIGLFCLILSTTALVAQDIKVDTSDGCGSQRMAVEVGRDNIRRDRTYRESDPWFQQKLAALQKCVEDIPKRRALYAVEKKRFEDNEANLQSITGAALAWMIAIFPLAIFLSYAQSAGVAGNGALVRLRDWKGQPLFLWLPIAGAAAVSTIAVQISTGGSYDGSRNALELVRIAGGFITFGLLVFAAFTCWTFLRESLWATLKGVVILLHYLIARHPAQQHLPSAATEAIARSSFGHAVRTHDVDYRGFWRELVTPSFVRRHKLERAAQVKAQLDADAGILKSAIERESARAAYIDTKDRT